jgi:hypothetical protein
MEYKQILKKLLTYDAKDDETQGSDCHDGGTNVFLKRMEQTKHGLIHEDDDESIELNKYFYRHSYI